MAKVMLMVTDGPIKGPSFVFESHDLLLFGRENDGTSIICSVSFTMLQSLFYTHLPNIRRNEMSTPVTLILSDQVYRQAKGLATQTGRSVADLLTKTIERSFLLSPQALTATVVFKDNLALAQSTETERLTEELYGLVKRTSSYEELDELYNIQSC